MSLMSTDRYSSIRQAFLFWDNLAREEQRQSSNGTSKGLILSCSDSLLSIILGGLEITELDVDSDM